VLKLPTGIPTSPFSASSSGVSEIILASTSVYRRELVRRLLPDVSCMAPGVDEDAFYEASITPDQLATRLAYEKANAIATRNPHAVVIGSDQLVDLDGRVLGKPGTAAAAVSQLLAMSGRAHRLLTAVCVIGFGRKIEFLNETQLHMRAVSQEEATRYVERDSPLDCAGSYRIESLGISLFDRIQTDDFTAIMGLPLLRLSQVLRELGVAIP